MSNETYVYSLKAASARLRKPAKSVLFFWPGSGRLVRITLRNIKRMRAELRRQSREGGGW